MTSDNITYGARVRVYRNLHRGKLSVQTYVTGKGWRVAGHVDDINLVDVVFQVNEAGRNRVLRERKKNVHAFVIGNVIDDAPLAFYPVRYNPYEAGAFAYTDTKTPVSWAYMASVGLHGVLASA